MSYRDPQLRAALAGEYVLGTLQGAARRRFERLLAADPAMRREVEDWQGSLYPLVEALPEREPPARVWQAVARRIAPPPPPAAPVRLWESLAFWRGWGLAAAALALMLAVYVGLDLIRPVPPVPPDYVAVLNDDAERPAWLVRVDQVRHRLSVQTLRPQDLAADRSFELWLLPGEGQPPQSLGLIPASGGAFLDLTPELAQRLPEAQGLAVSLEPAGGSPTGQPTGPVLYLGAAIPPA